MKISCCRKTTRMKPAWTPFFCALFVIASWLVFSRVMWIQFGSSDNRTEERSRYGVDQEGNVISNSRRKRHKSTPSEEWASYQQGCYMYKATGEIEPLSNQKTFRLLQCKRRLPNVLIVGVKECATHTLSKFLGLHPNIVSHSGSHFEWPTDDIHEAISRWKHQQPYSSRFQITVESSPLYSQQNTYLEGVVGEVVRDAKLIIMLRDPVERAISEYAQIMSAIGNSTRHKRLPKVFQLKNGSVVAEDMVQYEGCDIFDTVEKTLIDRQNRVVSESPLIESGVYVNTLKRIQALVANDSYLVIDSHVFLHDPFRIMRRLEKFLGLRPFFHEENFEFDDYKATYCVNVKRRPDTHCLYKKRHLPEVDANVTATLQQYYKQYDDELQNLLQMNFSWIY